MPSLNRSSLWLHSGQVGSSEPRTAWLPCALAPSQTLPVPDFSCGCRYDKSAFSGQGDRADPSTWPHVEAPVDVVLFEGWMLGFAALGPQAAAAVNPNLAAVDGFLQR